MEVELELDVIGIDGRDRIGGLEVETEDDVGRGGIVEGGAVGVRGLVDLR